jgi:hypothetical protein
MKRVGVIYVYTGRQSQTETQISNGGGQNKIVCTEYKSRFLFSYPYTNYPYLMCPYIYTIAEVLLYRP